MPPLGYPIEQPVDRRIPVPFEPVSFDPVPFEPTRLEVGRLEVGHSGARWMMVVGLCLVMLGLACTF